MPLFISYSHADTEFVDQLAKQLVQHRVHVWIDRWEMKVGDSLVEKIQTAISGADALLVILSKTSVESPWCKKELESGLLRELEERRVVVLPAVIEECNLPLFVRGKFYADFRTNPDKALKSLIETVAAITSTEMGRETAGSYHTDWSVDWGRHEDDQVVLVFTMIDHGNDLPHCFMSQVTMLLSIEGSNRYNLATSDQERDRHHVAIISELIEHDGDKRDLRALIQDARAVRTEMTFVSKAYGEVHVLFTSRRMGLDNGKDVLLDIGGQLQNIVDSIGLKSRGE